MLIYDCNQRSYRMCLQITLAFTAKRSSQPVPGLACPLISQTLFCGLKEIMPLWNQFLLSPSDLSLLSIRSNCFYKIQGSQQASKSAVCPLLVEPCSHHPGQSIKAAFTDNWFTVSKLQFHRTPQNSHSGPFSVGAVPGIVSIKSHIRKGFLLGVNWRDCRTIW